MKDAHKLTEGAILLAAFTVLLILSIYVPAIGMVLNFFLPVPFMLFAAKNNLKSILVFIVASLIISFITGTFFGIALAFAYGTTGAVMGYFLQQNKSRTSILIAGSIIFLLNVVIQYAVSVAFFHFNFIDKIIQALRDSLNMSSDLLKNLNQQKDSQKILDQLKKTLDLVKTLVPSLFVMSSFVTVFFVQLISMPILKRFGIKVENWKPFREISLPRSLIWYYLGTILAEMIFHPDTGSYWNTALTNLSYVLQLFMIFQGLSFIFYFFHRRGISRTIPVLVSILAFIMPILLYIVGLLGIIDLGFGLRENSKKKE